MTASSSVASSAPASIEAAIRAAVLRPIMSKYSSTDISVVGLARRDVDVLALAQRDAGLVVQAHQAEDLRVAEAEIGQPVERHPAEAEQHVAGVDRLGDAVERPDGRPVAALAIAVLDVVVDEAEVVAELDRRRAGQGGLVVAGDRGVGEEPEQRPHPLAGRRARTRRARGGSGPSRTRRRSRDRGRGRAAGSPPRCRRSGRRARMPRPMMNSPPRPYASSIQPRACHTYRYEYSSPTVMNATNP